LQELHAIGPLSYQSFSFDWFSRWGTRWMSIDAFLLYYLFVVLSSELLGPYWWDAWLDAWKAFIWWQVKSFRSYQRFPTPSEMFIISAEPTMSRCPVGKVPSSHKESSSNHSLPGKACLFSAKGCVRDGSAFFKGVMRQTGAWRILKEQRSHIINGSKGNCGSMLAMLFLSSCTVGATFKAIPRSVLLWALHLYVSMSLLCDSGIKDSNSIVRWGSLTRVHS